LKRGEDRKYGMKRLVIATVIFLALVSAVFSRNAHAITFGRRVDFVPQPRLLSPAGEEVDLAGKDKLEFRWSPHENMRPGPGTRYYDFRLYKGYQMLESTLLLKKRVPGRERGISLEADMFKAGQVYTWSLRNVYKGTGKSDRSASSFKVVK
jgi:hypothetical protein